MRGWGWLVWACVGCGGDAPIDSGPVVDDTDPPDVTDVPPWAVAGEQGQLVLFDRYDTVGRRSVSGYGVFANELQGFLNPALCATGVAPCVLALPEVGAEVDQAPIRFRPKQVDWRWVGDALQAGPLTLGFTHDVEQGLAFYRRLPDTPVQSGQLDVTLAGEWAGVTAAFPSQPGSGGLLSPEPGAYIDLTAESVDFRWTPGEGRVYFHLVGDGIDRVLSVEDNGAYTLDLAGLPPVGPRGFTVHFVRWHEQLVDAGDNQLSVVAVTEDQRGTSACVGGPDAGVVASPSLPFEMEMPYYFGVSLTGITNSEGRPSDYLDPDSGAATSAAAVFTFYDSAINPVCTLRYDLDSARALAGARSDSGARIFWAAELDLSAPSETDCGRVPTWAAASGDIRDYLTLLAPIQVGYGELDFAAGPLIDYYGAGWPQVQPFYLGGFTGFYGSATLYETNFGYTAPLQTCFVPDLTGDLVVPGPPPVRDLFVETLPIYVQFL